MGSNGWKGLGKGYPSTFSQVFILKAVKVVYFDRLLEVFILKIVKVLYFV